MALRDTWHRALTYFGLAEDERYVDDDTDNFEPEAELEERYRAREQVRRVGSRKRDEIDDIFADDAPAGGGRRASCAPSATAARATRCGSTW